MKNLVEALMQYKEYPEQTPPWSGWEYVPETTEEIKKFCNAVAFDWWEGVEWCCLQADADFSRLVVAADGHVWEVGMEEFTTILEALQ